MRRSPLMSMYLLGMAMALSPIEVYKKQQTDEEKQERLNQAQSKRDRKNNKRKRVGYDGQNE